MERLGMLIIAAASLLLASCSSSSDDGEETSTDIDNTPKEEHFELTTAEKKMVDVGNDFAFRLLRAVSDDAGERSMAFSPMSTSYLLGMLAEGAEGQTREEIVQLLGLQGLDAATVNGFFHKMLTTSPRVDLNVTLSQANALYGNQHRDIRFLQQYVKTMQETYSAAVSTLDFTQQETLGSMNRWCSEHTKGLIPEMLTPQEYDADAMAYLLNAVYFQAPWTSAFDEKETGKGVFTTTGGQQREVYMMQKTAQVDYFSDGNCQVAVLPYGNGSYQMMLILPSTEGSIRLSDMERQLSSAYWQQMLAETARNRQEVRILLPRFHAESKTDLISPLMSLGMKRAFANGDFSRMLTSQSGFQIQKMLQKAVIEVSEQGTKSATGSMAEIGVTSPGQDLSAIPVFNADHPFLYVIYESSTHAIFFIGEYAG